MEQRPVRLVMPHQLYAEQLDAPEGTAYVLVEHDLMFRQYAFHTQKLVLHRASMRRFADRLRGAGREVVVVESSADRDSRTGLLAALADLGATSVTVHDVVDDWLGRDLVAALDEAGLPLRAEHVLESPNFLTTRAQVQEQLGSGRSRMQTFYAWQRRRLDVLVESGEPVGGRWSFDADNRKRLPRGHPVPDPVWPDRDPAVSEAIAWVVAEFPDNPGDAEGFAWPTSPDEAEGVLEDFLAHRFADFGPYEDAVATEHPFLFHSLLTPALNIGLLSPEHVLRRALEVGAEQDVPLASLEGFVRQLIGWREYVRATYVVHGRRMRTRNRLEHARPLDRGWWDGTTGLEPVDRAVRSTLRTGWAHHIERLMVLGNAMCLLRTEPDAAYEWFMEMFVDAYDWVMVPNVYAMSQFAAGDAVTTKPYVSGSNYLRTMSDLPKGEWCADWDALYWTFVRDHHDVFAGNARSKVIAMAYDRLAPATKAAHTRRAHEWLG